MISLKPCKPGSINEKSDAPTRLKDQFEDVTRIAPIMSGTLSEFDSIGTSPTSSSCSLGDDADSGTVGGVGGASFFNRRYPAKATIDNNNNSNNSNYNHISLSDRPK